MRFESKTTLIWRAFRNIMSLEIRLTILAWKQSRVFDSKGVHIFWVLRTFRATIQFRNWIHRHTWVNVGILVTSSVVGLIVYVDTFGGHKQNIQSLSCHKDSKNRSLKAYTNKSMQPLVKYKLFFLLCY